MTQQHEPQAAVSAPPVAPGTPLPRIRSSVGTAMVGVDHASIMGMELISAILLWTGLGYLLDRWLGTTPWLLVAGGLLGNAAGIYLIWIRSGNMERTERERTEARRQRSTTPEGRPGER